MIEESSPSSSDRESSMPVEDEIKFELVIEAESPMTKSVGTRIYASPEQWQADKTSFDQRVHF